MSKSEYKNNINKKANDGNINSYSSANQNAKGQHITKLVKKIVFMLKVVKVKELSFNIRRLIMY